MNPIREPSGDQTASDTSNAGRVTRAGLPRPFAGAIHTLVFWSRTPMPSTRQT